MLVLMYKRHYLQSGQVIDMDYINEPHPFRIKEVVNKSVFHVCLSVCFSVCLFICLFVYLFVCLSVCLFVAIVSTT